MILSGPLKITLALPSKFFNTQQRSFVGIIKYFNKTGIYDLTEPT